MARGLDKTMPPRELRMTRPEYQEFTEKIFVKAVNKVKRQGTSSQKPEHREGDGVEIVPTPGAGERREEALALGTAGRHEEFDVTFNCLPPPPPSCHHQQPAHASSPFSYLLPPAPAPPSTVVTPNSTPAHLSLHTLHYGQKMVMVTGKASKVLVLMNLDDTLLQGLNLLPTSTPLCDMGMDLREDSRVLTKLMQFELTVHSHTAQMEAHIATSLAVKGSS